jgi:hypothetical protein
MTEASGSVGLQRGAKRAPHHVDGLHPGPQPRRIDVSVATQLMSGYPHYTFTQSAAAYNDGCMRISLLAPADRRAGTRKPMGNGRGHVGGT